MKNIAKLLAIPLMVTLLSCGDKKEPIEKDFNDNSVFTNSHKLVDVDNDGKVDEIYTKDLLGTPIYVAEGSKSLHEINYVTRKMGSNLRLSASNLLKATTDFNFDLAKQIYDDANKKYGKTGGKK